LNRFTPGKIVIHCEYPGFDFWTQNDSAIKDLFSTSPSLALTLYCHSPGDYTPISEGEGASIVDGYSVAKMNVETKRLGFRFKVRDRRSDLRIAFEELMNLAIITECDTATPIIIDDYCYLSNREDRARGYRRRIGFFSESLSGLQGHIVRGIPAGCNQPLVLDLIGSDRYEGGFEFKFMEVTRSSYY
jgi:hypothetical protein